MRAIVAVLAAVSAGVAGAADGGGVRILRKEMVVRAPLPAVWHAWTTPEGLRFISGTSNVELRVGGPYEWFLDGPPDEHGRRGGEGARVLAFLPETMLAFTWTFPPAVPSLRGAGATTQAVVLLDELGEGQVRVRFAQHGWGEGEDWDAGYAYFDRAWSYVLQRLKETLEAPRPPPSRQ